MPFRTFQLEPPTLTPKPESKETDLDVKDNDSDDEEEEEEDEYLSCGVCCNKFSFVDPSSTSSAGKTATTGTTRAPDHRPVLSTTCPHAICLDCVTASWNKMGRYKGECPFCRTPFAFPMKSNLNLLALELLRFRLHPKKLLLGSSKNNGGGGDAAASVPPVCIAISNKYGPKKEEKSRVGTRIDTPPTSFIDSTAFRVSIVASVGNGFYNRFYDLLSSHDWITALHQVEDAPWQVPRVFQALQQDGNLRQITSLHAAIFFGAPPHLIRAMVAMDRDALATRALFMDTGLNLLPYEWAERLRRPDLLPILRST